LNQFKDNTINARADFIEQKIELKRACGRGGTAPGINWIYLSVWYARKNVLSKRRCFLL